MDDELLALSIQRAVSAPADHSALRDALWHRLRERGWTWTPRRDRAFGSRAGMTDRELLVAFLEGDPDAFETFVARHGGALRAYALSNEPADGEDCAQDAFLVLFQKAAVLLENPEFKPRPFLFGVARKRILDRQRKRFRADKAFDALAHQLPPDDPSALEQLLHLERTTLIEHLSECCTPLEQDVLLLALNGNTNPELAATLELTRGHVRVLKHRAITKIKAAIAARPSDADE